DYASLEAFYNKIDGYFSKAQAEGFLQKNTIVVLPEHIGTALIALDEKETIFKVERIDEAFKVALWSNLYSFLPQYFNAPSSVDKKTFALFAMKSEIMAKYFQFVFSSMAIKYNTYVVPGSIILSNPQIKEEKLVSNNGELYNISLVYQPNGKAFPQLVKEIFPTKQELAFIEPGKIDHLPVFNLPVGNTKVLLGNDAWYRETHFTKYETTSTLIAPSFLTQSLNSNWDTLLTFLSPIPEGIDPKQKLTVESALLQYGIPKRLHENKISRGATVFLRGKLWDLTNTGSTIINNSNKEILTGYNIDGASIINLWVN
ncbi:MAG: hypothetical protein AAGI07_06020, partial [Bacteroidota bacterium]